MAHDGSNTGAPSGLAAWLGGLLAVLVSGEDLRVRRVIAGAVTLARSNHDLEMEARWHARHNQATNARAE
jgi:hypothetical protein